jgi:hypothetical protein
MGEGKGGGGHIIFPPHPYPLPPGEREIIKKSPATFWLWLVQMRNRGNLSHAYFKLPRSMIDSATLILPV